MKARLLLLETIQKDAERQLEQINRMVTPFLQTVRFDEIQRSITAFNEAMRIAHEPLVRFEKQAARMLEERERWITSHTKTIPTFRSETFVPHPVRYIPEPILTNSTVDALADKVVAKLHERKMVLHTHTTSVQIDLTYTTKARTLSRTAPERVIRFNGNEDNKRRDLFEKLIHTSRMSTQELTTYLGCPNTDATHKVIHGLNKKMKKELCLTMNLVDGSDRSGYRIHKHIAIHQA